MATDMAPPNKRRKIAHDEFEDSIPEQDQSVQSPPSTSSSHTIQTLLPPNDVNSLRRAPQRIEEVHLQIQQHAVAAPDSHQHLHKRQGTAVSLSQVVSTVTVVVATGDGGSTIALVTQSTGPSSSDASTATVLVGAVAAGGATSSSAAASPSSQGTASLPSSSAVSSAATSDVAPTSASSLSSVPANTNGTATGVSGSSGGGNGTVSTSTGAIIIINSSTTYTSHFTSVISYRGDAITSGSALAANATASSSSSQMQSTSSSSKAPFVYLATLPDGRVETITPSDSAYVTTFPDGPTSTIAPYTTMAETTTDSNGDQSTYYSTVFLTPTVSSGAGGTITSYATAAGAGGGAAQTSTAPPSTSTSGSPGLAGGSDTNNSTPPPGTIAGGVVGATAGVAVIVLIAMLFLRWFRRRAQLGHQALPIGGPFSPEDDTHHVSRGPGMAERAGLMPVFGAVPAFFRHQDRSLEPPPEPTERGFHRVSGRKLPSSFSPGMTAGEGSAMSGIPPTMPLTSDDYDRNLSGTSFYRDSYPPSNSGAGPFSDAAAIPNQYDHERMTLSPGPQRRPTVHAGGPYTLSPDSTPTMQKGWRSDRPMSPPTTAGTSATFDRSDSPSTMDPNRSSRFTEEV